MSTDGFTFYPSLAADPDSWPWRNRVPVDGALISLDVLPKLPLRFRSRGSDVKTMLGYDGYVVLDNGAFGRQTHTNAGTVDQIQAALDPDLRIVLDVPTARLMLSLSQREAIRATVTNARRAAKANGGTERLMAVVQGNTPEQIRSCAASLGRLGFTHVGVPVSSLSKRRAYAEAVAHVQVVRGAFERPAIIHALGCGSRTMMALMSTLGVRSADSSSYYKVASRGQLFERESMCSIGAPYSKPECAACLKRSRPPTSFAGRCAYNLREIMKEVQRSRCAADADRVPQYLSDIRLPAHARPKVLPLLDLTPPQ